MATTWSFVCAIFLAYKTHTSGAIILALCMYCDLFNEMHIRKKALAGLLVKQGAGVRCLSLGAFQGWRWIDTNPSAIFAHPFIAHDAVNFCEDRKVASHTDIDARMDTGTEL